METLMEVYTRHLAACVADPKHKYPYGVDKVPAVAAKMREKIPTNGYVLDGPAWAATLKELKLKKTYKAVQHFIANHV